jgi:hypothetical protein
MNLLLRPNENINDPTWSVIISLIILLAGVLYYVAYILRLSFKELQEDVQVREQGQERVCKQQETESGQRNS